MCIFMADLSELMLDDKIVTTNEVLSFICFTSRDAC